MPPRNGMLRIRAAQSCSLMNMRTSPDAPERPATANGAPSNQHAAAVTIRPDGVMSSVDMDELVYTKSLRQNHGAKI